MWPLAKPREIRNLCRKTQRHRRGQGASPPPLDFRFYWVRPSELANQRNEGAKLNHDVLAYTAGAWYNGTAVDSVWHRLT